MANADPPRGGRLQDGRQFREVYRSGKSFHGTLMSLISLPKPDDRPRVAYVASRKVGGAVVRNRAKRLLREAYRQTPVPTRERLRWRIWIARASCPRAALRDVTAEMALLLARES